MDASLFLSDCYGAHVALWFATNEAGLPTRLDACESLPGLFERGTLTVLGLLYDKGAPVQIPAPMWNFGRTLTYSELHGSWFTADRSSGRWWSKLRVPSADAMRVWEPFPANGQPATSETAEDTAARPRPRRIATRRITLQSQVETALIEMFPPKGEVSGISVAKLGKRLANEKKINCGPDVIRRAMGLKT